MYCRYCGKEISDLAAVCVHCGQSVNKPTQTSEGHVSAGWWWLGFLIPLAGFLIWIFSHETEPIKAKKAGIGAIVGTVVSIVSAVLFYVLYFVLIFGMFDMYDAFYYLY